MTVEDPIEFLHSHKRCLVNQREVGEDTRSFVNALKHVLRQDPGIILVGELRDLETISIALTAGLRQAIKTASADPLASVEPSLTYAVTGTCFYIKDDLSTGTTYSSGTTRTATAAASATFTSKW
jgi:hypothetical protein